MEILTQEPYFKLDTEPVDEIAYNQSLRQQEKLRFYQLAMDMIANNRISGDYWEFGCHRARTFRMAMQEAYKHEFIRSRMHFYAFDSFKGLPQDDNGMDEWKKGSLATSEESFKNLIAAHLNLNAVKIHKGFYNEVLPKIEMNALPALITVDCDLYDSAVSVFEFIEPYLKEGTLIYVDDYFVGGMGCQKAFKEFQITSKHIIQEHLTVGWWGKSFIVL